MRQYIAGEDIEKYLEEVSRESALVPNTVASFIPPKLTTAERNALLNPVEGMLIFNTTTSKKNTYTSSGWVEDSAGGGGGDVSGPASNTADYLPQWNGADSKLLKNGLAVPAGGLAGLTALAGKEDTGVAAGAVSAHAGLTTGVHGVGAGTIAKTADIPVGGTPAVVLGTVNTAGSSPNFLRRDDTILVFDAASPTTQAFSDSAVVGTATVVARRDHKHAMMAAPTSVSGNAGSVTNATLTTALTVNTGTVGLVGNAANTSVLTLAAGASSITGANTGDNAANSSVHYVGTTSIACNRASASQGLTGISSIDGSAATLTTSRNIGGRAFNGSADIVAPTWKTGITTRDVNTASGTVNVAHGLGRVPSVVRVTASLIQAANTTECHGCYDGTNHSGLCSIYQEGATTATTDTNYSSTAFELGFSAATVVNPYTGANRQTATITVDTTNIVFTWTKTGTVASAVANILWECA